ncbi:hypothetical protein [Elioraea sp.]|uniref:hypothetical protein n=1 Tax=Elioraea sp. TaxID=2185103 RepID=UPI0025C1D0BE|nr:hypothetical protein [Elioraea sp.]
MTRLLPFLRQKARALATLAVLAILAPALAGAITPRPAAAPFSLVICTTEGLVTIALGDELPSAPAGYGVRDHCPACLRADPALAMPPQAAPAAHPAHAAVMRQAPAFAAAPRRATPHARPDPTGPPLHA